MQYFALCFALILLSCQAHSPISQANGVSEFVNRQAGNESVIVFVHGVTGDAMSTWTNKTTGAYWPRLIANDPDFRNENTFVYEYPSPKFGQSYNINELAEDMRLVLTNTGVLNHKRIIFLAHSMGGLIVRQYLLKYREAAEKVSFIYFYATPTTGSPMATLTALFSKNPQLGNLKPMKVDEYLGNLQRDWLADSTLRDIPSFCAYEMRNTLTARIVEQESASNLCNRRLDPIDKNHIDIVKPESMQDKPYQAFKGAYLEYTQKAKTVGRTSNSISQGMNNSPGSWQIGKIEGPVVINSKPQESLADVGLRFVYPKSPALKIVNLSDSLARDIKWMVVVWNMDLPDRNDPLPIPVSKFDWVKAHNEGGPQNLFNTTSVSPLLKPGNRLFGMASVDCTTCSRGRTYIVNIIWGQGGWVAEVEDEKSGMVFIPLNLLKDSRVNFFKILEVKAAENLRVPIREQ